MNAEKLISDSEPFLRWLVNWYHSRPTLDLAQAVAQAGGADGAAVLAVDVTVGFCAQGSLASERVGGIVAPIVRLFERAHGLGVRHYLLPQDTHSPDAVEFGSFPPHCVRGSDEPLTVAELRGLPFAGQFLVLEKDSISSDIGTGLDPWLEDHPQVKLLVVSGDCTDLCVYQLAMHLRLRANAHRLRDVRIVVPIAGVDTYDTPLDVAEAIGAPPHPADLIHLLFLYHMALNGVEVVAEVR